MGMEEDGVGTYFTRKKDKDNHGPSIRIHPSWLKHGDVVWAEVPGMPGRQERIWFCPKLREGEVSVVGVALSLNKYREAKRRVAEERARTHKLKSSRSRISRPRDVGHVLG